MNVANTVLYIMVFNVIAYSVIHRFRNPGFTETELFLAQWPVLVSAAVVIFLCSIWKKKEKDDS